VTATMMQNVNASSVQKDQQVHLMLSREHTATKSDLNHVSFM